MSLAEDLLNTLNDGGANDNAESNDVEEPIIVDETRRIIVPNKLKTIAVKGDKNVETVTFKCIRYWDAVHDLSNFVIYINYILPNNTTGTYIPEIKEIFDDYFTFDWLIGREITKYNGSLTFLILARRTDNEGKLEYQWSSLLNSECTIAQGLEIINVTDDEEAEDRLTSLLEKYEQLSKLPDEVNKKLTKDTSVTDESKAYVKAPDGTQTTIDISSAGIPNAIVALDENGQSSVAEPTEDTHIANKKYVDDELAKFDFIKVVPSLDAVANPLPNKIYLVPKADTQNQDLFDEWVWVNKGTEESPNFDWEWVTTKQLEVDLTPYVKKDEVDEFLALPLETGEGENSLVIDEGNASGDNSIAGGTTDINLIKSVLGDGYAALIKKYGNVANMPDTVLNLILNAADVGYTLDEFKRLLTISPTTAEGLLAISLGASNKSKSTAGISLGYGNISGGKGYYISAVNTAKKTITLSTKQDTASAPANNVDWEAGDRLFITNDDRYWCEVSSVSGNVVTLKALPFTKPAELKEVTIPFDATYNITNPTERSVINIDKPESGEVDIGWGAIGIGALNTILGSNAFGVGYKNLIAGDFGASFGQENQVGYSAGAIGILINALAKATFGAGCGHTLTEKYQSAVGKWSKENKKALFRVGNGSNGNPSNAMEVLTDGTVVADKFKGGLDYTLDEKKYQYRPIFFSGYKAGTDTPDGIPHLNSGFEYNEGENTLRVGKINLTNISKGAADVFRNVWFSDNTTDGKVNHNSDFQYNPATGVLKVGGGLKVGNTEITEEQLKELTALPIFIVYVYNPDTDAEDGFSYEFKKGWTWSEFMDSKYSDDNFSINETGEVLYMGETLKLHETGAYFSVDEEIIEGSYYI